MNELKKRAAQLMSLYDEQMSIDDLDIGDYMEEQIIKASYI